MSELKILRQTGTEKASLRSPPPLEKGDLILKSLSVSLSAGAASGNGVKYGAKYRETEEIIDCPFCKRGRVNITIIPEYYSTSAARAFGKIKRIPVCASGPTLPSETIPIPVTAGFSSSLILTSNSFK